MEWDGEIVEWVEDAKIVWESTTGQPKKMGMKALKAFLVLENGIKIV